MNEKKRPAESSTTVLAADEVEVRDLLRGAGPRPEAPREDLDAIRAVARVEWRRVVAERESAPRFGGRAALALAASLLLALVAGWWWMGREAPGPGQAVASVEGTSGTGAAIYRADAGPLDLVAGAELPAGALIETPARAGASPSRLALRLAGGQSVRLDGDTRVRLASSRRIELERGALYLDSGLSAEAPDAVEIATAFGVVRDIGTQFEVRLETDGGAMRVRVREGEVVVNAGPDTYSAGEGEELSLDRDGRVRRAAVARHGSDWGWVMASAPGLDIEGRSLRSYLDWASRETGLWLRFEDNSLEHSAAVIGLHGTIENLTPEQSLDPVLSSTGLAHRVEDGVLLIIRPR